MTKPIFQAEADKVAKFPVATYWVEEFKTEEKVSMIENSVLRAEADILAETYYHTCTVKRPVPSKDELGFDSFEFEEIYKDIECAVSFNQGSTSDITDTTQPIMYIATLFTRPEITIEAGDWIVADVLGNPYEFRAGEGAIYQSHRETPLIRKDDA